MVSFKGTLKRLGVKIALILPFASTPEAKADMYLYKDNNGVVHFTNVPTHSGYRRVLRESDGKAAGAPGHLEKIIRAASNRHGVDADLVRAVVKVESDFDTHARSRKGAQGLMQLMPETAQLHNVGNVYDPNDNIDGGVRHLRYLLDRYQGDLRLTLAAYNAGVKAVERYSGIPPFAETREYIRRVLDHHQRYRRNGTGIISIREEARP